MSNNIVIFSDGTGQAGGINFDEARTNVYKLFRACRVGPERHVDFGQYFGPDGTGKPAEDPQCVADDIEAKWVTVGYPDRL